MEILSDLIAKKVDTLAHVSGQRYLKIDDNGKVIGTVNVEETDPTVPSYVKAITSGQINQWDQAYSWGNHAGLYRPIGYVPSWSEITSKPTTLAGYGITDAGLATADITAVGITTSVLTLTRSAGNLTASIPTWNQNTTGSAAYLSAFGNLTTQHGNGLTGYAYQIVSGTTGLFSASNNSNAVLTINRHAGNYYSQLGFNPDGAVFYRAFNNVAIDTTLAWQRIYADNYHPKADKWTTARTLTIGNTGKAVDGSANVSWTLAEIGAQAALTNPVTGTGVSGQVTFWNGTNTVTGDTSLTYSIGNLLLTGSTGYQTRLDNTLNTIRFYQVSGGHGYINNTHNAGFGFATNGVERWFITSLGVFQSNGAQTIQSSTGNLTIATAAGNGNVEITPHGTGFAQINKTTDLSTLTLLRFNTARSWEFRTVNNGVSTRLELADTTGGKDFRIVDSTLPDTGFLMTPRTNTFGSITGNLVFTTGGANGHIALIPNGSGNVLIGTTVDSGNKLRVSGSVRLDSVSNGVGDIVRIDANGVLTRRTVAQTLTDIGAAATSHTHPANQITAGTFGSGDYVFQNQLTVTGRIVDVKGQLNTFYNNLGSPMLEELAIIHGQMNNKFRFLSPTQEESTDGITWTASSRASTNVLGDMMRGEGQGTAFSAIPSTTVGGTGFYRLTWNASQTGYIALNKLYVYCSTNGNNVEFKIERKHNTTGWETLTTGTINNWPGHVFCNHSTIWFHPSNASQYSEVRISFRIVSATNTNVFSLYAIEWFGGYPAGMRNVESYDKDKNVFFPAAISGTRLISTVATGTAPLTVSSTTRVANLNVATAGTADAWTTARTLTIGSTGKSVNGSANVSWSLAEIGAAAASHTHTWGEISGTFRAQVTDTEIIANTGVYRRSTTNEGFIWHGRLNGGGEAVQLNLGRENGGTLRWRDIGSDAGPYSSWKIAVDTSRSVSAGTGLSGGGNLSANRTLSFDTTWGDARYALASHNHSAANITSGILAVERGGTGIGSYTTGNYLRALNATTLEQVTPAQIVSDLGISPSSFQRDLFTYSTTNVFTLTRTTPNGIMVFLQGQKLQFGTDWTISGNVVTVTHPILTGNEISIEYYYSTPEVVPSNIFGTGLANRLTKWNGSTEIGLSLIQDDGTTVTLPANTVISAAQATVNTNKFMVLDGTTFKFRTASEILSDIGVRTSISLTTTGTSGAATYNDVTGVFNIPNYTYTHPTFTAFSPTLTGANVLASLVTNTNGHVTAITTRALTAADIGAAASSHAHAATDITSGILAVARGGTGIGSYTTGNYIRASGATTLEQRTPAQVLTDIGAGYLGVPQVSQSANYTLILSDQGKHILHPAADTTARTFTIPANSSVAFPIGTAITFVNQNGAGVITIAITTDTMRLGGAGTTGNRTLGANGVATALKITSTEWIISGTNLT